jgi:phosphate transport system permease protein
MQEVEEEISGKREMNKIIQKEEKTSNRTLHGINRLFRHGDIPWNILLITMGALVIILMAAIGWLLWQESSGARAAFGLKFILPTLNASWNPVKDLFQSWPFIYGTLLTSLVALVIAVPVSLGISVFLAEISPQWMRQPLSWLLELLAAIPSVIYGLWGIFIFLPIVVTPIGKFLGETLGLIPGISWLFKGSIPVSGASRLAAGLVLAIMIIPTITAVSRDVLKAIPQSQREASLALGATHWETIWKVLFPFGVSGILGAVILGLGRALGETMAVTMVIGNSIGGSLSLLQPGYTMSSIIANEFAEAVSALHSQALIEIGLILFVMTLGLNFFARFLVWRVAQRNPQEAKA